MKFKIDIFISSATFQMLKSHMWLVGTILEKTEIYIYIYMDIYKISIIIKCSFGQY